MTDGKDVARVDELPSVAHGDLPRPASSALDMLARHVTRNLPYVDHYKGDLKIAEAIREACEIAYRLGVAAAKLGAQ